MNKQAITFLSLFSLILVLSVYYIMLPPASNLDQDITVNEQESETYDVAKMQEELEDNSILPIDIFLIESN